MKKPVDRMKKGKGHVVNVRFAVMCGHYLFDADFCNVASGWSSSPQALQLVRWRSRLEMPRCPLSRACRGHSACGLVTQL